MGFFSKLFNKDKKGTATVSTIEIEKSANNFTQRTSAQLSEYNTRKLEGTDTDEWYYKCDPRTKEELHLVIEQYYNREEFSDYTIVQQILPEFFGVHPMCKPIDFLFCKGKIPVLAVNIVTNASIPHHAVKSVYEACLKNGIRYLRFIVGCPNTEHYVVRRTLEALGEIPPLY